MEQADLSLFVKAVVFAADKHKDQRRKDAGASPYINHPIALTNVLLHEGGVAELDILVGALLHDTVEDTDTSAEELREVFGARICSIVLEVTDDKRLDKPARKRRQIEKAPNLSIEAKAVKLADKICNLRDVADNPPPSWSLERRQAYFDWAKQVIDGLRGSHRRLERIFDEQYARRP